MLGELGHDHNLPNGKYNYEFQGLKSSLPYYCYIAAKIGRQERAV